MHVYIRTKGKQIAKRFYIQKVRHFAKIRTICVTFLYTKPQTLYVARFFMIFLRLAFIYKNNDTLRYVTFLYTKIQTLRKKQDNLRYVFIYKNPNTLRYTIFIIFLKLAFMYKNYDNLRYAMFLYTKIQTLRKKQDNLRYVFIKKILTLCVMLFFMEFLKLEEGGDILYEKKQRTLCYIFICKKQYNLRCVFIYKNPDTFCSIFICKKLWTLRCILISKIYCIVLIPNYK